MASASEDSGGHLHIDGIAQESADQGCDRVERVASARTNVRQAVDGSLRRLRQLQVRGINTYREIASCLLRVGLPVDLAIVRRTIPRDFTNRVAGDGVGKVSPRHVEGPQYQQHEHADHQRELHQCLARPPRAHRAGIFQQEQGQILVLFAITAAAMLAVIGLLYTFGIVLDQRRSLQGAADSASLAGTWQVLTELQSDNRCDANVLAAITKYASANGVAANGITAAYVDAGGNTLATVGSLGTCPSAQFLPTARGVAVTVTGTVSTILPGFVGALSETLRDSATAIAQPSQPPATAPVIPIAVSASAFSAHATYDLFAHPPSGLQWSTLDLSSAGGPTFSTQATEAQYWSDGQHLGSWQLSQPATVNLLNAPYYDSVAAGLSDNVRRQALSDSSNRPYALVTVPMYDTVSTTPAAVHVVGFAQLKILGSQISATSAIGTFVPYPAKAFAVPSVPSPDVGATLVILTS